jgi:hypothetical protein
LINLDVHDGEAAKLARLCLQTSDDALEARVLTGPNRLHDRDLLPARRGRLSLQEDSHITAGRCGWPGQDMVRLQSPAAGECRQPHEHKNTVSVRERLHGPH